MSTRNPLSSPPPELEALLRTVQANPRHDAPRLVLADWLDEQGETARAELIRVQCELAAWVPDLSRRKELARRERTLIAKNRLRWAGPISRLAEWSLRRGMVRLSVSAKLRRSSPRRWLADLLDDPWMSELQLSGLPPAPAERITFFRDLQQVPMLDRLATWVLAGNQLSGMLGLVIDNPHLATLHCLDVRNNNFESRELLAVDNPAALPGLRDIRAEGNPVPNATLRRLYDLRGTPGPGLVNSIGMRLLPIPAGEFPMGSPRGQRGAHDDESPRHTVTLTRPFWLSMTQVTQEQYVEVMGRNPSHFLAEPGEAQRLPVDSVTWIEAYEFCQQLSNRPEERAAGRRYRLPTEAEWEHACRAGTTTIYSVGDDLNTSQAQIRGQRPSVVGSFDANAFGLFDMHGNLWEWTADWFDAEWYRHSPRVDPTGPPDGEEKVLRGGSFETGKTYSRSASRVRNVLDDRYYAYGFRVACDCDPGDTQRGR